MWLYIIWTIKTVIYYIHSPSLEQAKRYPVVGCSFLSHEVVQSRCRSCHLFSQLIQKKCKHLKIYFLFCDDTLKDNFKPNVKFLCNYERMSESVVLEQYAVWIYSGHFGCTSRRIKFAKPQNSAIYSNHYKAPEQVFIS